MTHLSEHFTLEEFTASQTADRLGIDNTPGPDEIEAMRALCVHVLEPLRQAQGPVVISSGYRCLELNRAIGSIDTSQHTKGQAADICTTRCSLAGAFNWIRDHYPYDQLIREFPPRGWVHVSYVTPRQPRGQMLLAKLVGGKTVYETITEAVA